MANIGPFSIRFDQRKSDNTAYKETYVSGSNLVIITDTVGNVTGSKNLPDITASNASFGTIVSNGIARFFDIIYAYAGIVGNVTGSLSGSRVIATTVSASSISTTYLSASFISGTIASSSYAENANLLDGRDSTTYASTGSNIFKGNQQVTGSVSISQSLNTYSASMFRLFLNDVSSAPTNATDAGITGEVRIDNNFMYVYTNNRWKRFPNSIWQ